MPKMKNVVFYHIFQSKAEEDEFKRLNCEPSLHEWEVVETRDEPVQVLQLFPWEMTKVLITSDLGYMVGLQLSRELVHAHVFKHWDTERVTRVLLHKERTPVKIRDIDTRTDHDVFFRKCFDNDNFCFQGGWVRNFVVRRRLRVGMEIGMYWDTRTSTFRFSVLKYNPQTPGSSKAVPEDIPRSSK